MRIYEINNELDVLLDRLIPDEDGVYEHDPEETNKQIQELQMLKKDRLEWIAKKILNNKGSVSALKEEEKRLYSKRKTLENQNERLMKILETECEGKKTDLGVASVNYRRTESVEVYDTEKLVGWLVANEYTDCVRFKEPEVSKTELKKLILSAEKNPVPWADVIEKRSCYLK